MISWTVTLLHPSDPHIVESNALSVSGRVQVGYVRFGSDPSWMRRACTWASSANNYRSIHPGGGSSSTAHCIRQETIVGEVLRGETIVPYRWRGSQNGDPLANETGQARAHADETTGGRLGMDAYLWFPDGTSLILHKESDGTIHGQSQVNGMFERLQAGTVWSANGLRAYLWEGVVGSARSLHPTSIEYSMQHSEAHDIHGDVQVGHIGSRACLWRGTPESVVSLHPPKASTSVAHGTYGAVQVGTVYGAGFEACAWTGSPSSLMNLHSVLPSTFSSSRALGIYIYPEGRIMVVGHAINTSPARLEAVLWVGHPTQDPPFEPPVIGELPLHY